MGILNHRSNGWYISLPPSRVKIASLLSFFVLINAAAPQSVVKTLPGYPGATLPFNLETGYVTVGQKEDVELFYYFVESETDPERDPLMLWLTGGPGCSAFCALAFENIGPLTFVPEGCEGGRLPTLRSNPYSWTKVASIIFLDVPVGTGFSYATTSEAYHSSDTNTTEDVCIFVRKWLLEHPKFIKNRLYIGGDSYAGKLVPMITLKISQGIDAGLNPKVHLQGFVIGNPLTDKRIDRNSRVPFAHRLALLSDEYYEMARINCGGEYANPDPTNVRCLYALKFFEECTANIHAPHVLEPKCSELGSDGVGFLDDDDHDEYSIISSLSHQWWCRSNIYVLSVEWANDPAVQEALHIRNGTIKVWKRCNGSLSYDKDAGSVVPYHKLLSHRGYESLVYSGDHDMKIPYIGTRQWIRLLNLTIDDSWRPWLVDAQIAGLSQSFFPFVSTASENLYSLLLLFLNMVARKFLQFSTSPLLSTYSRTITNAKKLELFQPTRVWSLKFS